MDAPAEEQRPAGEHLPPWVPRLILMTILSLAGAVVAYWLFLRLRDLIVMLFVSLFLSFAMEPAVKFLTDRGWRRGFSTGVVFMGVFIAGAVFIGAMLPLVVDQIITLLDKAPQYLEEIDDFTQGLGIEISTEDAQAEFQKADSPLRKFAQNTAGSLLGFGSTLLGAIFRALTVALFSFYLVADGPRLRRTVFSVLKPERQREALTIWELAIAKTGGYVYSRALLAAVSAGLTWLVLAIIGVPYPLALALWVGVLSQLIPVFGTYIAALLPIVIAILDEPIKAVWVAIFLAVYQQIENYFISPRLAAHTMSLHPAVAFGSAIAGASIMGPVGAILALPTAATLQAFISTLLHRYEVVDSHLTSDRSATPKEQEGTA